jgi:hypothetical protein
MTFMKNQIKETLTVDERKTLTEAEHTITSTRGAFVTCGLALARIRDNRLYRESYRTFEVYCQEKWGWHRRYSDRLIEAAEVSEMSPIGLKPTTECQARAIAGVPAADRERVLRDAAASGPVTAASIAKAAKVIDLDATGRQIPASLTVDWHRADEVADDLLKKLSYVKCSLEGGIGDDVIFAELNNTTISTIKNAYGDVQRVKPYAVCPTCGGHGRSKCTLCRQRGFISKFTFDTALPSETKQILKKGKK